MAEQPNDTPNNTPTTRFFSQRDSFDGAGDVPGSFRRRPRLGAPSHGSSSNSSSNINPSGIEETWDSPYPHRYPYGRRMIRMTARPRWNYMSVSREAGCTSIQRIKFPVGSLKTTPVGQFAPPGTRSVRLAWNIRHNRLVRFDSNETMDAFIKKAASLVRMTVRVGSVFPATQYEPWIELNVWINPATSELASNTRQGHSCFIVPGLPDEHPCKMVRFRCTVVQQSHARRPDGTWCWGPDTSIRSVTIEAESAINTPKVSEDILDGLIIADTPVIDSQKDENVLWEDARVQEREEDGSEMDENPKEKLDDKWVHGFDVAIDAVYTDGCVCTGLIDCAFCKGPIPAYQRLWTEEVHADISEIAGSQDEETGLVAAVPPYEEEGTGDHILHTRDGYLTEDGRRWLEGRLAVTSEQLPPYHDIVPAARPADTNRVRVPIEVVGDGIELLDDMETRLENVLWTLGSASDCVRELDLFDTALIELRIAYLAAADDDAQLSIWTTLANELDGRVRMLEQASLQQIRTWLRESAGVRAMSRALSGHSPARILRAAGLLLVDLDEVLSETMEELETLRDQVMELDFINGDTRGLKAWQLIKKLMSLFDLFTRLMEETFIACANQTSVSFDIERSRTAPGLLESLQAVVVGRILDANTTATDRRTHLVIGQRAEFLMRCHRERTEAALAPADRDDPMWVLSYMDNYTINYLQLALLAAFVSSTPAMDFPIPIPMDLGLLTAENHTERNLRDRVMNVMDLSGASLATPYALLWKIETEMTNYEGEDFIRDNPDLIAAIRRYEQAAIADDERRARNTGCVRMIDQRR